MAAMKELETLLAEMLGPDVAFALSRPGSVPAASLHPAEAEAVTRAVEKRRLEMAAGRAAARAALASFGLGGVTIPQSSSGAPIWPAGIVGSITHTNTVCAAAVAKKETLHALGIDAEPDGAIDDTLWPDIATEEELHELVQLPREEARARARQIFCAKEAAYKCQYPMTGLLLDFGDLQIRWTSPQANLRTFEATYQRHAAPFRRGDCIGGLLGRAGGHVLAVVRLTHDPEDSTARSAKRR